jgi:hypothetical protein
MAESFGDTRDASHRYSPSYASPRTPPFQRSVGPEGGPNACGIARKFKPIPGNGHEANEPRRSIGETDLQRWSGVSRA